MVFKTLLLFCRAAHSCHTSQVQLHPAQAHPAQAHPLLHAPAQHSCPSPLNTECCKNSSTFHNMNSQDHFTPPGCQCLKSGNRPLWSWPQASAGSSLTEPMPGAISDYLFVPISGLFLAFKRSLRHVSTICTRELLNLIYYLVLTTLGAGHSYNNHWAREVKLELKSCSSETANWQLELKPHQPASSLYCFSKTQCPEANVNWDALVCGKMPRTGEV